MVNFPDILYMPGDHFVQKGLRKGTEPPPGRPSGAAGSIADEI